MYYRLWTAKKTTDLPGTHTVLTILKFATQILTCKQYFELLAVFKVNELLSHKSVSITLIYEQHTHKSFWHHVDFSLQYIDFLKIVYLHSNTLTGWQISDTLLFTLQASYQRHKPASNTGFDSSCRG